MAELVFEIGCEEMPARFVRPGIEQMLELGRKALIDAKLLAPEQADKVRAYGTPRRLALIAPGLAERQPDQTEQVLGPPLKAAYDEQGNPTKAALGFAAGQGIEVGQLQVFPGDKGARVGYTKGTRGRPAMVVLSELLPQLVETLHFPKAMRWGSEKLRFARPIHWFLAILGKQVVPFELAGIRSSNLTRGHRFLAPDVIAIDNGDDYLAQLELASVIADRAKRKALVDAEVAAAAQKAGGQTIASTPAEREMMSGLSEEVADLVELPIACLGSFDQEFLEVPRPVIITAMREHQRYFPLQDAKGNLLPSFIAISNTRARDMAVVTQGHQRVIRARLSDARFFLREDGKRPLISRLEDLKQVTYHAKLGTSFEKVERVAALAFRLADILCPDKVEQVTRAARLAKCDLVTGMVGEFPSLQGQVGADYARRDGEAPEVAAAIAEHYMPVGAGAELPEGIVGTCVGMADRLDSICGLFGIGQAPTGAADPYGLRRAAIAVIRLVTEKGLKLSLDQTIIFAQFNLWRYFEDNAKGLSQTMDDYLDNSRAEITNFFASRMAGLLAEQGVPTDVADAVLAAGCDDLVAARARALALSEMKTLPDFAALAAGLKRVMNILRKEAAQVPATAPDPALFQTDAERGLHQGLSDLEAQARERFAEGQYLAFLQGVSALKGPIDKFFDDVMVMVDDQALRQNRLALLNQVSGLFSPLAEFTKLQLA